jgi:hypothetical protein
MAETTMGIIDRNSVLGTGTIYDAFEGTRGSGRLPALCLELLDRQKEAWPAAGAGYESLNHVRERELECRGFSVRVQHNPGRIKSTLADVGEENVAERACFLCPANLSKEQKGILYRKDYLILCNPMPVFSSHFTISHLGHRPQELAGAVATLLTLMSDFGPGSSILYNGPRCGASAPDHLHFQAVPSGRMPIEKEIHAQKRALRRVAGGVSVLRARGVGREVIILDGPGPAAVGDALHALVKGLQRVLLTDREPMMNLICLREEHTYTVLVFPRAKHRPDAFYLKGDGCLAISPAVVEMGGIMVTPLEKDFERLDRARVKQIFNEVSLPAETVERAIDAMG